MLPARSGKLFQSSVLDQLEGLVVEFENMRGKLDDSVSSEQLHVALEHYEKIARLSSRLGSYSYMYFSEDTRSQESRTFKARAEEINADTANRTLFFELWWKSLDAKKIRSVDFKVWFIFLLSSEVDSDEALHAFRTSRAGNKPEGCNGEKCATADISPNQRFLHLRYPAGNGNQETG